MKTSWIIAALGAGLMTLASCTTGLPLGSVKVNFKYATPAKIDVTRTDTYDKTSGAFLGTAVGYVLTQPIVEYATQPGSLGITFSQVKSRVKDGSGNSVAQGFEFATQSVGVRLEPGLWCPDITIPKPCVFNAKDTVYAAGPTVTSTLTLLDKPITDAIAGEVAGLAANAVRQYRATMNFVGEDFNFQPKEILAQDMTITVSLAIVRVDK